MVKIICERVRTNDIITSILLWFPRRLEFEMWRRKKRKKREKNEWMKRWETSEKKDFNIRERSWMMDGCRIPKHLKILLSYYFWRFRKEYIYTDILSVSRNKIFLILRVHIELFRNVVKNICHDLSSKYRVYIF